MGVKSAPTGDNGLSSYAKALVFSNIGWDWKVDNGSNGFDYHVFLLDRCPKSLFLRHSPDFIVRDSPLVST